MLKVHSSKEFNSKLDKKESYWSLLLWGVIGTILRFTQLSAKPPWTDEFATMVFSLGNQFEQIPLNQVISADEFLAPLRVNSRTTLGNVISLILDKDNHPPLYFILSHLWIKLFSSRENMLVSLWGMRSLPALFGIVSIPLIYWVAKKVFNSSSIGHFAAGMIAVSSYGVFISQEARHYTLAILFVIASLGCFIKAYDLLYHHQKLSFSLIFIWIIVNSIGLSVHYFLSLVILAEALSLGGLLLFKIYSKQVYLKPWLSLIWVTLGTSASGLSWLYLSLSKGYGNEMIAWIQRHDYPILGMINPPFQLLSAWLTMFTLLPVESSNLVIVILSGLGMLMFFLWLIPIFNKAIRLSLLDEKIGIPTQALLGFISSLVLITFTITYGLGIDITRGARYSFIYFPPIILLMGVALTTIWEHEDFKSLNLIPPKIYPYLAKITPKQEQLTVIIIWILGLLGAITVLVNLGYQKYYLPNRLVKVIEQNSLNPALVVAPYISLSQTGEIMGIAWETVHQNLPNQPKFIILKQDNTQIYLFPQNLVNYPLDIWQVNFYYSSLKLDNNCQLNQQKVPSINGYNYRKISSH